MMIRIASLAVVVASSGAVAGETETVTLFDFGGFELFPIQVDLLPDAEGEIVNTNLDLTLEDVPEGTDAANLTVFASVPIDTGGNILFQSLSVTGEDLGFSGSGMQSVDFDSDALNGMIADPDEGFTWVVEFGTKDGEFTGFGPATGSFTVEYIPIPAPSAACGLFGVAALAARRRR